MKPGWHDEGHTVQPERVGRPLLLHAGLQPHVGHRHRRPGGGHLREELLAGAPRPQSGTVGCWRVRRTGLGTRRFCKWRHRGG